MRQIVLDTETTGLSAEDGHRIIEIGCLEVVNRRITGATLHFYVNPERGIDEGAMAVHGITPEMLEDKPRFAEVADEVLRFVGGAQVIIHNAPFDLAFLDAELARLGRGRFREACDDVLDTLAMARELHPGKRNSLDALCDRYGVSNAHRKLHGALLDAELLADVYLAMTRGQESLEIALQAEHGGGAFGTPEEGWPPADLPVLQADDAERDAHARLLESIAKDARGPALWSRLGEAAAA
ncbi:MAG TPA: DNA polymerase III subunit epsilon [Quisquiliibacterium sp.]|nr:DNA polymerase III subunit epsilon [Quisquiliibacterium sp.]